MAHSAKRRQTKNEIKRRHILKKKYGLTEAEHNAMLVRQNGVCAICRQPETGVSGPKRTPRSLAVDHDHKTGKVRGLLCHQCNAAIGLLRDDPALVRLAADYIEKHAA